MGRIPVKMLLAAALLLGGQWCLAEDDLQLADRGEDQRFNIKAPTLGGLQMWTDELVFRDWRIQFNAVTGHYRLLDGANQRWAWGTFDQCRRRLEQLKQELELPPMSGPVVLLLHGITRSRNSMSGMAEYLQEHGAWTVLNVSYASTRDDLDAHAAALGRVIHNLDPQVTEIHFVAHSLGNLVVRRYLHDCYHGPEGRLDPRIGRMVMLTPPNQGAQIAIRFRSTPLLGWVWGKTAVQLAEQWETVDSRLATPQFEFGIIAGGQGDEKGRSPLIGGDDDFVVGVEETKLPGATDFVMLPLYHSRTMTYPAVREYTLRFLEHGYFVTEQQRCPLPAVEAVVP